MEWYHWFLIAIGVVWVTCAVVNGVLLARMGMAVCLRGDGEYFWIVLAPFIIIPLARQYCDWRKKQQRSVEAVLEEAIEDIRQWRNQRRM